MIEASSADIERFMRFVSPEPNSGCWLFDGATTPRGYGQFSVSHKHIYAHRFSACVLGRKDVARETVVRHRCDVPCCVNPDHLEVGTQADNLHDMVERGRHRLNNRPLENSLKTHCRHGHLLNGSNLWIRADGSRICKACRARIARDWRKKNAR